MAGKYWSRDVTETSNALDLDSGVFANDDPKAIARSSEAIRRAKQAKEELVVSLRDVDADLLHQSRREESSPQATARSGTSEGGAARRIRPHMKIRHLLLGLGAGLTAGYAFARAIEAAAELRRPSPALPKDAARLCPHPPGARAGRHRAQRRRHARVRIWTARGRRGSRHRLRAPMAAPRGVRRAALARRGPHRPTNVVRPRIHAGTALRFERPEPRAVARRLRQERAGRHGARDARRVAARRRGAARSARVALDRERRRFSALRYRQPHRADLHHAALQRIRTGGRIARRAPAEAGDALRRRRRRNSADGYEPADAQSKRLRHGDRAHASHRPRRHAHRGVSRGRNRVRGRARARPLHQPRHVAAHRGRTGRWRRRSS